MKQEQFLTIEEAARELDVHAQTIRNYIRRGDLQAYQRAGSLNKLVRREDIEAMKEPRPVLVAAAR